MSEATAKKNVQKLQRTIVDALDDVKAQDMVVFDTEHLSSLFERVIVASGTSNRQTKALAASVRDKVREAGFGKPRIEGEENGEWIIVDCGPVVAHIMQPAIRQYYHLEDLWGEKPVRLKHGAEKPTTPSKPAKVATKGSEASVAKPVKSAPKRASKSAGTSAGASAPRRAPASGAKPAAKKAPTSASRSGARVKTASAKPVGTSVAKPARASAAKPVAKRATAKKPGASTASRPAAAPRSAKPAAKKTTARKA